MSALPYCILLLLFLHQRILAADGKANGAKPDKNKCSPTIIKQLSKTKDLVCDVNPRLNNTKVYLTKELIKETDAVQARLETHLAKALQIQDAMWKIYEQQFGTGHKIRQNKNCVGPGLRDCSDVKAMGFTTSGVYRISAGDVNKRMQVDVYCNFSSFNESWLVFQRRLDGSENFERLYTEYAKGFGNLSREFWLGNDVLHLLTKNRKYMLRVDLENFEGKKAYAEYTTFVINSAADSYRLTVGGYSGNAGDGLFIHNNMKFSTQDVDNDAWPTGSCAKMCRGAWWYSYCLHSNLNGPYLKGPYLRDPYRSYSEGLEWKTWGDFNPYLKKTEMKLMPMQDKPNSLIRVGL